MYVERAPESAPGSWERGGRRVSRQLLGGGLGGDWHGSHHFVGQTPAHTRSEGEGLKIASLPRQAATTSDFKAQLSSNTALLGQKAAPTSQKLKRQKGTSRI